MLARRPGGGRHGEGYGAWRGLCGFFAKAMTCDRAAFFTMQLHHVRLPGGAIATEATDSPSQTQLAVNIRY